MTGKIRRLFCLLLFLGAAAAVVGGDVALASTPDAGSAVVLSPLQEEPLPEDSIELTALYPVLKEKSGSMFEFQVELNYQGSKARVFDLSTVAPAGTYTDIVAPFTTQDKGIQAVLLEPGKEYPEIVKVRFNPSLVSKPADPGSYVVTLQVASGDISDSIDLTAVVTARYDLILNTSTGRLNAELTAGKDNHIGIWVKNSGSAPFEEIRLTSNVPEGWGLSFSPEIVSSLEPGLTQAADMVITPPSNTIAGDYELKVSASTSDIVRDMTLRITVETPTVWGLIGIVMVVAVLAGLIFIFLRLGRR